MIENSDSDQLETLLSIAVRVVGKYEKNPEQFFSWAKSSIPLFIPGYFSEIDKKDYERAAYWLGVAIWNNTPLISNHFRPRPYPKPHRNDKCPCGSGRKYKLCCNGLFEMPLMETHSLWSSVVETYSDKFWLDQAADRKLPEEGLLAVTDFFYENQRFKSLVKLLDPILLNETKPLDQRQATFIHMLCDAYDEIYKTDRKKKRLLEKLGNDKNRHIRSEAHVKQAIMLHDLGQTDEAWRAIEQALKENPDNPTLPLVEISLLCTEGQEAQAQARAEFWYQRLLRTEHVNHQVMEFLENAKVSPCGWFDNILQDLPDSEEKQLLDQIEISINLPLPEYRYLKFDHVPEDFQGEQAGQLQAPEYVKKLEQDWYTKSEILTDGYHLNELLGYLQKYPKALDSFMVIDDLSFLLSALRDIDQQYYEHVMTLFFERSLAILKNALPDAAVLPWGFWENRSSLGVLIHAEQFFREFKNTPREDLVTWYLQLNPTDNQGYRAIHTNDLLVQGRDKEVLLFTEKYPDDGFVETVFGRVLALYRLKQQGEALNALTDAHQHFPLVLDYLLKDKIRKPKLSPGTYQMGGKDQAWYYREAMRELWMETDGVPVWLEGFAKLVKKR